MNLDPWQRYTPLPYKKVLNSALSGRRGRYAHAYGIYAFFLLYQSNMGWGGHNAAWGLISRDIAKNFDIEYSIYNEGLIKIASKQSSL